MQVSHLEFLQEQDALQLSSWLEKMMPTRTGSDSTADFESAGFDIDFGFDLIRIVSLTVALTAHRDLDCSTDRRPCQRCPNSSRPSGL